MYDKRDVLGKIFFAAAILILLYMFIAPISNVFINIDEYWTYSLVNLPFIDGMIVAIHDVHPPLHYLILYLFTPFGLNNLYLLKVVSIIPYILLIIVSYVKIRKDFNWLTAGLFVFSIGIMSDFFLEFLTIRMYSWGLFFVLMSFIYYKDVIEKWDRRSWVLLTLFSLLSAYTQYFFAITCALIYLLILVEIYKSSDVKARLKQFIFSVLGLIALYAPWLIVLVHQIITHANDEQEVFHLYNVFNYITFFAVRSSDFTTEMIIFKILALVFLILILALIYKYKDKFAGAGIFLMYGTIAIGILTLMASFSNSMRVRYLIPVLGIFWLSASVVIGEIRERKVLGLMIIFVLLFAGIGVGLTHAEVCDRFAFNDEKSSFLDSINNNDSVIVYNTDYGYRVLHNDLNNTKQYTLGDTYFYSDDVEISKDFNKILKKNKDKKVYLVNWANKDSNKDFEDKYNLTTVYDAGHYAFNLVNR